MADLHEANGARFLARNDQIVTWERRTGQPFEPVTTAWMRAALASRAGAFVDVGASTGWFAIPFALAGREVHAFDCNRRVAKRFRENAALNGASLAFTECAIGDTDGETTFWHHPHIPLTSGGSIAAPATRSAVAETVRVACLDNALPDGCEVALLKVDVEGHEVAVMQGARATLARCRPHLVLEANTSGHRKALAAWLADFGGYVIEADDADGRNLLCNPE